VLRLLLVAGSLAAIVLFCHCQPAVIEPIPGKGQAFTDTLSEATLVRITDRSVDQYSGNGIQNEYARADCYDYTENYIILRGNDGQFYLYNADDYRRVQDLEGLGGAQEPEPRWSAGASGTNKFFYVAGPRLMYYRPGDVLGTEVHNFMWNFPSCYYITTKVEGDASADRDKWAFMVMDSSEHLMSVITYDLSDNYILGQRDSFPDAVNFVTVDASGSHVIIGYDSMPMQAFHLDFSHPIDFPAGAAGHSDVAQTANGTDVVVYQNVSNDYICMTDLETGIETKLLEIPFTVNPDIGLHISGNCYATPGWVLVSTYGAAIPPGGAAHSWMDNLLFMLELKADPRVFKVARTRCYTGDHQRGNYFAECFASINRAGTKIVFGSNWGIFSPQDYTDAYEARLPSDWQNGAAQP
jgi:hypothetical protein